MKKIYMSAAGVLLAASVGAAGVFAAGGSSITVRSDKSEVSYTYKAGDGSEAKADASKLFDGFRGVGSDEYKTENLTVTSKTQNGSNIEIALVIETENTNEEYSPLDYYSFVITADNGDVIYDGASEEPSDVSATSKEMPFGRFNTQFTTDTKKYAVDYKINSKIAEKADAETVAGLSVSVVSRIVPAEKDVAAPAVEQSDAGTEAEPEDPTYTVNVEAEDPEEVVSAAASPAAAAEEYKIDGKDTAANEVKKVCGKDIPAGRYLVSGNGIVVIESAAGELKGELTLTDGTVTGVEGVDAAVATITDGDVITARPLPGQEKPAIKFEKANASPQAAATNAAAASSGGNKSGAAKATAAPAKKSAAAKSNPKTGEDSPEIMWLCTMMAAAAAAVGVLEIIKRKKFKKS